MQVLLLSTYELGRQPVHVASPAAALREAGHDVRALDLAVDELDDRLISWAERVAISVPMHTATRLADSLVEGLRRVRPDLPLAMYGLYAGVSNADVDLCLEGEYEPGLLAWLEGRQPDSRHLGRSDFRAPDRTGLPSLDRYARLEHNGVAHLAGAVEASHGCRHRCRHCPIPSVYDGRIRVVPRDDVLVDIAQLVEAGARHVTFGDADFLNAPAHSLAIIEGAHAAHPDVTFDATVKVSHILDHRGLWPRLAAANLLFVVSAFESTDDWTLEVLDKGHTRADMEHAVELIRSAGLHIRPTWLPFMPWTKPADVADIFQFLGENELATATDPVQLSIKLLVPRGSLLEDHAALAPHLDSYDDRTLSWRWAFEDPDTELLQKELTGIAERGSDCGEETIATLDQMRVAVSAATGRSLAPIVEQSHSVPRLTESWFCCAEPTPAQSVSIGLRSR